MCRTYGASENFGISVPQRFRAGLSLCRAYGADVFVNGRGRTSRMSSNVENESSVSIGATMSSAVRRDISLAQGGSPGVINLARVMIEWSLCGVPVPECREPPLCDSLSQCSLSSSKRVPRYPSER